MVCPYCLSKTRALNSRASKKEFSTWRRRECRTCRAIFTTYEYIDLSLSHRIKKNNRLERFDRTKILLSLHSALDHRKTASTDAEKLTSDVCRKIITLKDPVVETENIQHICMAILSRFDVSAAVKYASTHANLQGMREIQKTIRTSRLTS